MAKFIPNYSEKDELLKTEIEVVDYFSLSEFYRFLHDTIERMGYIDIEGDGSNFEQRYWQREHPDGKKDLQIWWRVYKKASPLYTYMLKIDLQGILMEKKEVNHNGKRIKVDSGDFIIRMSAMIFYDIEKKFSNQGFFQKIWDFFYKHEYRKQRAYYEDILKEDFKELQEKIKRFLALTTIKKYEEKPIPRTKGL